MRSITGGAVPCAAGRIVWRRALGAGVAAVALVLGVFPAGAGAATGASGAGRPARPARTLAAARPAPADDPTASLNNLRTGWDPNEPGLSPSVVRGSSFGEVFSKSVRGQVYAQPLVIGSTVVVATEEDWVYGLNATTGAFEWSTSLGKPYRIPNCPDLVPDIGITSAPVYDPSSGTVYVMAQVTNGTYVTWRLFGINVATGAVTFKRGIYGSPSNDSHITMNAKREDQRAGLLLLNGWVYASFASHCDKGSWAGYVAAVDPADKAKSALWTDESGVTDNKGGIWQGGGGLMSDGPGRIIVTSGDGVSPPGGPGSAPPGQLAESVMRLAQRSNGTLVARDFFSPRDAPSLDAGDLDYGSAGPVGLPVGTTVYPHILVQGGKIGHIFLLNRDNLGGRKQAPGGTDDDLFRTRPYGQIFGDQAVFEASTSPLPPGSSGLADYVYSVGKDDYLRAFQLGTDGSGRPVLTDAANSTFTFGFGSGSPVVTSNGTNPSSAVVWVVHSTGESGTGASLAAFDALPQPKNGGHGVKLQQIFTAPIGTASKFTIAAPSNGMVYVGTRDGRVLGFGVTTGAALRRGTTLAFGTTAVGSARTRTATATAARTVTVTGISSSAVTSPDPFRTGRVTETSPSRPRPVPVTFPVTLHRGDTLRVPVTFAPAVPGGTGGTVSFDTAGPGVPANVPLIAAATRTGLYATAPSLSLLLIDGSEVGPVPVGQPVYAVTTIVNGGTTAQRITRISPPGGPFTARFLPRPGTILRPGQSVTVQIAYSPSRAVSSAAALTVAGSSGPPATVALSGTAEPARSRVTAPPRIDFGQVPAGHTVTRFIHIVNAGNEAATVAAAALAGPFRAPARVARGLQVNGGDDLRIPVTYTASAAGRSAGHYTLTWKDQAGTHTLTVPITATGVR